MRFSSRLILLFLAPVGFDGGPAAAASGGMNREDASADTEVVYSRVRQRWTDSFFYDARGLEFDPPGPTSLWIGLRFQGRLDTFPGSTATVDDLRDDRETDVEMRRARIKGGGTLFADWLEVYSEYDFPSSTLLDLRATVTLGGWLSVRAGQWKSEFNRERIDSSGKQQLVERSISTYWFTVDRQRAVAASARFGAGSRADTRVWVEYLSGRGRGAEFDGRGLWLGRVQWNPAGEQLSFSQSDIKRRDRPVPSLAVAAIRGRTPFTRFSSSGGGGLPGFEEGDYDLTQYLFETAVHYRGLGWQQELHYKRIEDKASGDSRSVVGGYAQLGSFLSEWWSALPSRLEVVGRVAVVDPDRDTGSDTQVEWTAGVNYFIHGHRHKITADYSWLDFEDPIQGASKRRFRLQYELSL
jgi:phosphate-selective porin